MKAKASITQCGNALLSLWKKINENIEQEERNCGVFSSLGLSSEVTDLLWDVFRETRRGCLHWQARSVCTER